MLVNEEFMLCLRLVLGWVLQTVEGVRNCMHTLSLMQYQVAHCNMFQIALDLAWKEAVKAKARDTVFIIYFGHGHPDSCK